MFREQLQGMDIIEADKPIGFPVVSLLRPDPSGLPKHSPSFFENKRAVPEQTDMFL